MGIDFGKLRENAAKEKAAKSACEPKQDLGDALEELNLPGGMLGGRPPSRCGTVPKKDE